MALQRTAGNAAVSRLVEEPALADEAAQADGAADPAALQELAGETVPTSVSELPADARSAIASDVEEIVQLLTLPSLDAAAQDTVAMLLRRWLQADPGGQGATPHLDELMRLLKARPLRRRSVRSMEATTAETAYDALWITLDDEALGTFGHAASISGEGSNGPLAGESAAFWAGLGKTRAMGLYAAFEAVAPGADRHEDEAVERLSHALAGIEADPEWMEMVERGGENRGAHIFGDEYGSADRLLLRTEAARVPHKGARYLWRMIESSEEDLPWLGEQVEPSDAAREVRLASREIARRIDMQRRIARLSGPGLQRDSKVLSEIIRLTGWITRLAAKGHGLDDASSRDGLRRLARDVARELEPTGAKVRPGTYERELVSALERPELELPERQEDVAGVLLDLLAEAAEQLVKTGHPGGGSGGEEAAPGPPMGGE
jgi:hypothetical protein